MKKITVIFLILLTINLAYGQKYIDKIADLTCECLEKNKTLVLMNPEEEMGKCALEAMSKYSKKIEKEFGSLDGENAEQVVQSLMEKVGVKLGLNCPTIQEIMFDMIEASTSEHYQTGNDYFNAEEYALALEEYVKVEIEARDADFYNNVGLCYYYQENFQEALPYFKNALELNPESTTIYQNLALAYEGLEQYDAAIEAIDQALTLTPDSASLYNTKGRYFFYSSRYDEACKHIKIAIEMEPEYLQYYKNLAYIKGTLEEYDTAIIVLKDAMEIDPEDTDVWFNMGYYQFQLENYEDALVNLSAYNEKVSAEESEFQYLAMCHYNMGQYAEAKTNFLNCRDTDEEVDVDYRVARCDYQLGNYDAVIDYASASIAQDSIYGEYRMRAMAYMKNADYAGALKDLKVIQENAPCGCEVYQLQSTCFEKLGKAEDHKNAMIVHQVLGCDEENIEESMLIMKY